MSWKMLLTTVAIVQNCWEFSEKKVSTLFPQQFATDPQRVKVKDFVMMENVGRPETSKKASTE